MQLQHFQMQRASDPCGEENAVACLVCHGVWGRMDLARSGALGGLGQIVPALLGVWSSTQTNVPWPRAKDVFCYDDEAMFISRQLIKRILWRVPRNKARALQSTRERSFVA